jgi:hypothetical protein
VIEKIVPSLYSHQPNIQVLDQHLLHLSATSIVGTARSMKRAIPDLTQRNPSNFTALRQSIHSSITPPEYYSK